MTAKDLNLLTDPAALAAWARDNMAAQPETSEAPPKRARPRADLSAVNSADTNDVSQAAAAMAYEQVAARQVAPPARAQATPARALTGRTARTAPSTRAPWILAAAIAVMNMLFLVLAGLWLTGTEFQSRPLPTEVAPQDASASNERLNALGTQMATLNQQMSELRSEIEQLRAPLPSDITVSTGPDNGKVLGDSASAATDSPLADPEPADPAPVENAVDSPRTWQVNLGDFNTRSAAQATLAQLGKIGLQGQIRTDASSGSASYMVTLDNFVQREDAEAVANDIMRKTELNGLWVARSSP